jgi:hypothetical protein
LELHEEEVSKSRLTKPLDVLSLRRAILQESLR